MPSKEVVKEKMYQCIDDELMQYTKMEKVKYCEINESERFGIKRWKYSVIISSDKPYISLRGCSGVFFLKEHLNTRIKTENVFDFIRSFEVERKDKLLKRPRLIKVLIKAMYILENKLIQNGKTENSI